MGSSMNDPLSFVDVIYWALFALLYFNNCELRRSLRMANDVVAEFEEIAERISAEEARRLQ